MRCSKTEPGTPYDCVARGLRRRGPRSAKVVEAKPLARRVSSLDGKAVAFPWGNLFRGDEVWPVRLRQEPTDTAEG